MLTVDFNLGHITVENDKIKAVLHYKSSGSDGGGCIYELYRKPDIQNLVSNISWGPVNDLVATPLWAGVGGVGSTTIYGSDIEGGTGFTDVLTDISLDAVLESTVTNNDPDEVIFNYDIYRDSTKWYRVTKQWLFETNGEIKLTVNWYLYRDGWYSEPSMRSQFIAGHTAWRKYGKPWSGDPSSETVLQIPTGETTVLTWDTDNYLITEWVELMGGSLPTIRMAFSLNGSAAIVESVAGQIVGNEVFEQTSFVGDPACNSFNWLTWWGGNPPPAERYFWMLAGTEWTDSWVLSLEGYLINRQSLVPHSALGSYSKKGINLVWTTADPVEKEEVVSSGADLLIVRNIGASSHTIKIVSVEDPYGRIGDIQEVIEAGEVHIFGPIKTKGWRLPNGKLSFSADSEEIKWGVISNLRKN